MGEQATRSATTVAFSSRDTASGAQLRDALLHASAWLTANAERINALNVYPVPDGDTGTNMSLTLRAAEGPLRSLPVTATVGQVARLCYEATLEGARGNSGVILSQLFLGFAQGLEGQHQLSAKNLADALEKANQTGRAAVSKPVEGTMLTLIQRVAGAATAAVAEKQGLLRVLSAVQVAAKQAVADTPGQLEVLRLAGVVDSGAEGVRVLLEGASLWAAGRTTPLANSQAIVRPDLHALGVEDSRFGFCTEFVLRNSTVPETQVKTDMQTLGDSVLVVGDQEMLRVHVHTSSPGRALDYGVERGTIVSVKVENMELQHQRLIDATRSAIDDQAQAAPTDQSMAVLALAGGDGFAEIFQSLGAAVIVAPDQGATPSGRDVVAAIDRLRQDSIVLLPNVDEMEQLVSKAQQMDSRTIRVIPTTSPPQGIAAILAINYQSDLETNVKAMSQAAASVRTLRVLVDRQSTSPDMTGSGRVRISLEGTLVAIGDDAADALLLGLTQAQPEQAEVATLYSGAGIDEADADLVAARLRTAYPELGIEVARGGQPECAYLLAVE